MIHTAKTRLEQRATFVGAMTVVIALMIGLLGCSNSSSTEEVATVSTPSVSEASEEATTSVGEPSDQEVPTVQVEEVREPTATALPATEAPTSTIVPPTSTPEPVDVGPTDSSDIADRVIDAAIAAAEGDPFPGLPGRNQIATSLLSDHMRNAGYDLTGLGLVVYRGGAVPSFLLLSTDDSTPLLAEEEDDEDTAEADRFVADILASSTVQDFGIERLILQHSGVDDGGTFVLTFNVLISDLEDGLELDESILDRISVQVERPS